MSEVESSMPRREPRLVRLLLLWVAVRVALGLLTFLSGAFPYGRPTDGWHDSTASPSFRYRLVDNRFLDALDRSDAQAYLLIAFGGYVPPKEGRHSNAAFFPGYAWAVRAVHGALRAVVPESIVPVKGARSAALWHHAAHLVSTAAFLAFLCLFWRWMIGFCDRQTAWRAGVLIVASPLGFVFSCIMSEALFLFASFGALAFAEKRRWLIAAILATAAAATKSYGIVILVSLIWIGRVQARDDGRRVGLELTPLALVPLGLFAVLLHFAESTGSLFTYAKEQARHFGHQGFPDFGGVVAILDWRGKDHLRLVRDLLQIAMTALAVIGCVTFARRATSSSYRHAQIAAPLLGIVVAALSGTVVSLPRYASIAAPAYLGLALLLGRGRPFVAAATASFILQALLWLSWIHAAWIVI